MKNLLQKSAIFVALTVVLSMFVGCGDTSATSSETAGSSDKTSETKPKRSDYPPAPEAIAKAEFELINGETFKLEDNKGKVVLFNLWAIWCGPCIKEMPHLNELHERFNDKGLVIVGVNTGNDIGKRESKENIEKFIEKQNLKYSIGQTERPAIDAFFRLGQMGGVIPQSFLINRNGELTGIFQGGSPKVILQMKEVVEKVVNEESDIRPKQVNNEEVKENKDTESEKDAGMEADKDADIETEKKEDSKTDKDI